MHTLQLTGQASGNSLVPNGNAVTVSNFIQDAPPQIQSNSDSVQLVEEEQGDAEWVREEATDWETLAKKHDIVAPLELKVKETPKLQMMESNLQRSPPRMRSPVKVKPRGIQENDFIYGVPDLEDDLWYRRAIRTVFLLQLTMNLCLKILLKIFPIYDIEMLKNKIFTKWSATMVYIQRLEHLNVRIRMKLRA